MKPWVGAWEHAMGLPPGTPETVVALVALICIYAFVILPSAAAISFLERKLSADLQARVGPNRAGPGGIFQPFADFLKLIQKEGARNFSWKEALWLGVHTMALYSTVAVLPLGSLTLLIDTDMSAFLPFWAALVLALGTMLLGLNQGSVPGWFGGVRIAAQALSGAFPALISLLCVGISAGGFSWSQIAQAQGAAPWSWTLVANPFQFVGFMVFLTSGLVLLGVPPLNGGLSLNDIHGGVSSHLQGRRLSLFRLGRFYGFFLWCVIAVVLFLGGWNLPEFVVVALKEAESLRMLQIVELLVLLAKTYVLMLLIVWLAQSNPQVRSDQITDLSWRVLSPLSLFALAGAACWAGWSALS